MKKKIAVLTSGWSIDYLLSVLEGMKKSAEKNNADLYVFTSYRYIETDGKPNTTSFAILDLPDYKFFDGIVIMPNLFNDDEQVKIYHKKVLDSGVPAVTLNQPLEGLSYIGSNNHGECKKLINHLIEEHDVKKLAFIGGPDNNPGSESNYLAYKEALSDHNLPIDDKIVYLNGDWSFEFGYECAEKLFANPKEYPEAVVCINDLAALAVEQVATNKKIKIPEELKIIGFDDIEISGKVVPSITTISIKAEKMGEEAIDILCKPKYVPVFKEINAEPVYRQSCGCQKELTQSQYFYSLNASKQLSKAQQFASQLRHLEDTFIQTENFNSLSDNLQNYFERRHKFEGEDIAILLKDEVLENILHTKEELTASTSFGKKMRVLVNLSQGKAADRKIMATSQLFPENLQTDKPALYLFLAIYNRYYLHGYYIARDNINMLENKSAYNWTRNFGTIIEKFRQTAIYRNMSEKLKILSTQDSLSGLLNRTGLETYGNELFKNNTQNNKKIQIIFVDINNMKVINDKFDHLQGDLAVKTVAESIKKVIPRSYIAVRYGGDEFVIIGTKRGSKDYEALIHEDLANRAKSMALPYELTVSSGQKVFEPGEKDTLLDAIKTVDKIMYENKEEYHRLKGDRPHKK